MLELRHIHKTYEGSPLLTDISFNVDTGETICLLGASGSGKSTLLRMIAGLEEPDSGNILFNGMDLAATPPHLRDFGLVFQDYALFPHLNVNDNVAFGLRMRRLPPAEIRERVAEALELVSLSEFGQRRVTDLSGGEQQRVALARALAIRPRLLMFDEPLGALDKKLKDGLLEELRAILHRTQIPAIYVTHDQEEAFTIADRILILHDGQIVREGTPAEVWAYPQSAYVAGFLGLGKVFEGAVMGQQNGEWQVESGFGIFHVRCNHKHSRGEKVHLLARPFKVQDDANAVSGVVTDVIFQQDRYKVTFDNGLFVYLDAPPKVGEHVTVRVKVECLA
ncbi:MAG: ABC transporter ATP-binding protein [Chloroflexota bacterium]|nr:ABC transporter ATP-binding protein [Chloroflexota bacterium]MBI5702252.1 ABC transporter ATP-binding protein [Chloroflexota bacterium]